MWHEVECGLYQADQPLWAELARAAPDGVLDVGAGTGRVALALAAAGHEVVALDLEDDLLGALRERAGAAGLALETVGGDARNFELGRRFALILAPMQTVQLLGGAEGRSAFLRGAARHLAPGALLACALADALEGFDAEHTQPPLPDILEEDGWVYASQPVAVRIEAEGAMLERIRQTVSPDGRRSAEGDAIRLDRLDAAMLEREGAAAGLTPAGRRRIDPTEDHVGSEVVLLHG
jgi:SAM-dependent methyltransferase